MSLKEHMEELKNQIKAAEAEENKEEEVLETESAEEKVEEEATEEVKEEVVEEEKPKKTASDYAKERKLRLSQKKELDVRSEVQQAVAAAMTQATKAPEQVRDIEPSKEEDPQAWNEWNIRQLKKENEEIRAWKAEKERTEYLQALTSDAERELASYENAVKAEAPDYDAAKQYYANMLAGSIRVMNPSVTNDNLVKIVNDHFMRRASQLLNEGYENPVAVLYEEAKSLGFKGAVTETEEKPLKPDLNKLAANRARNAGTAGAGSSRGGNGDITKEYAAKQLTNAEFARLTVAEKQRLLYGA